VRVALRAPVAGAAVALKAAAGHQRAPALQGTRPAYFAEAQGFVDVSVYRRGLLAAGDEIAGPAVVEEEGSTLVIGPGGHAVVAPGGNLVVSLPS